MLKADDNELITRVGRGTPMGEFLRLFWLPFLLSEELAADGPPERIRLLGEDLVAFRDTSGRLGLIAERCPHRLASLYFGRNEQHGLRCLYHGWKFDVSGQCVDMPSEPPSSLFKEKMRTAGYPCVERNGVGFVYMGPLPAPPLPHFEWLDLPPGHVVATKRMLYCNWVQALEGEFDQSHVSYVHANIGAGENAVTTAAIDQIRAADTHPAFEVTATPFGLCIAAGREAPERKRYWRITNYLLPFYSMTGPYGANPRRLSRAWVPIDDTNALVLGVMYHPLRPLTAAEREQATLRSTASNIAPEMRAPATSAPFGKFRPLATLENDFFQDREAQRARSFSGIPEFWAQDAAMTISMGEICDRTQEHLGTSDLAIIRIRQQLLAAAKAHAQDGTRPAQIAAPDSYLARGDAVLLAEGEPWWDATAERRTVVAGVNPDCP